MNSKTEYVQEACDRYGFELDELISEDMAFELLAKIAEELNALYWASHHAAHRTLIERNDARKELAQIKECRERGAKHAKKG
jgi:hypothetical protein